MIRRFLLDVQDVWNEQEAEEDIPRDRVIRLRINFELNNDASFKEAFRLSTEQVEYVLNLIGRILQRPTTRSKALSAKQRILLVLHWLGNGAQMHSIGTCHGVVKSTVSTVVEEVVDAVIDEIFPQLVRWPTDNAQEIARAFQEKGGFPCVAGCIDGTLINIDAPTEHEEVYVGRQHFYKPYAIQATMRNCAVRVNPPWPPVFA